MTESDWGGQAPTRLSEWVSRDRVVTPALLSDRLSSLIEPAAPGARAGETLRDAMERVESWYIRRALERSGSRRTTNARQLGITREGLYN